MCVPECFIREDGKGFVVRKGGIDWDITQGVHGEWPLFTAFNLKEWPSIPFYGDGDTIMEAVDDALAKIRNAEATKASVQEGKREA